MSPATWKRRPAGNGAPSDDRADGQDHGTAVDVDLLAELHEVVAPYMRGPAPAFGSREWLELAEDDPRRTAGLYRAALARWAEDVGLGAPVPRFLRQASHGIAAGENWREVAGEVKRSRATRARREARWGRAAS